MNWQKPVVVEIISALLGLVLLLRESAADNQEIQPPSLDLSTAIAQALQDNPDLKAKRQALGVALGRVQQAELLFQENPRLSVDADYRNRRFAEPSGRSGADVEVRLLQEIEIAGQRGRRREAATKNLSQAEWAVADAERRLRLEVIQIFYELLGLQEKSTVQRQLLATQEELVQAGRERFDRGDISILELNALRLDQDRTRSDLVSQEGQRISKEQHFRLLLGIEEYRSLSLIGNPAIMAPDPTHPALSLTSEDLTACALAHRPDVKAARLALEGREAELQLAQARRIPNISVGPMYKLDDQDQVVGGALSIPLPFFNRNQHEITEAMANLQVGQTEVAARTRAVKHETTAALARWQLAARQLASYEPTYLSHLTESMEYARKAYEAGELSIFEFSVTSDRLIQTRLRYLDATLAYLQAKAELDAQSAFQCVNGVAQRVVER